MIVTVTGVAELSRAAKFDSDTQLLLKGKLAPTQFERRWGNKSIGRQIASTWQEVLALGHKGLAEFDDFYPRRP